MFDTVIIGGGAAGLSAALVLGRCVRRVLVFDDGRYRNTSSKSLHCFMGSDGVAPSALLKRARSQLARYDTVSTMRERVSKVEMGPAHFLVEREGHHPVMGQTVLVATGVVDELPKIPGLAPLFGTSVHVCPYCDG